MCKKFWKKYFLKWTLGAHFKFYTLAYENTVAFLPSEKRRYDFLKKQVVENLKFVFAFTWNGEKYFKTIHEKFWKNIFQNRTLGVRFKVYTITTKLTGEEL